MKYLHKDLILDKEHSNNLFKRWIESNTEYDYITWLKLITMHYCEGGASYENVAFLKKTIIVLITETKNIE